MGGRVGYEELEVSHNLVLRKGMTGVFLCDENHRWELPTTDYYPETNSLVMWCPYGLEGFIRYFKDGINYAVVDWQFSLDSLAHVYEMIELYTSLTLVDCGGSVFSNDNNQHILPTIIPPTYPNQPIVTNSMSSLITLDSSFLHFNMINRHIISTTTDRFFEFDIALDDDWGVGSNLHSVDIVIQIPTVVFGTNVVSNSHIIVTGTGAMANNDAYFINTYDLAGHPDNFVIQIIPDSASTNMFAEVPDNPTPFIHVVIRIVNCNFNAPIHQTSGFGVFFLKRNWTTDNHYTGNTPIRYALGFFSTILEFPSCDIHIDNILSSHDPIRGGTDDTVSILGMNFDTTRGTGNVWLRNANDNTSYLPLDSSDYLLWNDTVIKFIMPGVIENSTYFINNQYGIPGSGKFKVQNSVGDTAHGDSITVRFSVNEQWSTLWLHKDDWRMIKTPGSPTDGYQFRYDTSFSKTLHPDRYNAIDVAIKQWGCLNGVNFTLGDSIIAPQDSAVRDGINIIQFGKSHAINVIAATKQHKVHACGYKSIDEIDIVFNQDLKDFIIFNTNCGDTIPAGFNDGYSVLLHELGHAHSLNHINDQERIMYWAQRPYNIILPGNERNVYIRYDMTCDEGSAYLMASSANPGLVSCADYDEMIPNVLLQCDTLPMRLASPLSGSNGINFFCPHITVDELDNIFSDVNIFPNPAHNTINMNFTSGKFQSGNVMIYDIYGRIISIQNFKSTIGKNSFQLDIENISSGIYSVGVVTGKGNMFFKFTKE